MAITAAMVKELRELSGAGMMDCKKALNETNGNMEEAMEFLRKNGQVKAEKKASRIAAEGIVKVVVKDNTAAIVEVNSETDFVAKNEKFQTFVEKVANQALASDAADMDAFMKEAWLEDSAKTVNDVLVEQVAVIGENLKIRRFEKASAENGCVVDYIHGGGRIGVVTVAETDTVNDTVKEAMKNIAMQIAALNPQYISRADISDKEIAKMREITIDSALNDPASLPKPIQTELYTKVETEKLFSEEDLAILAEKKNDKYLYNFLSKEAISKLAELAMAGKATYVENKIFAGLVEGRISKQVKEISLLDQVYVKAADGKQTVAKYLEEVSKEVGTTVTVKKFIRFETGEGLEKKNEDFAAEVAAQLG